MSTSQYLPAIALVKPKTFNLSSKSFIPMTTMLGPHIAVACQVLLSVIFCLSKMSNNSSISSDSGSHFFQDLDQNNPFKTMSLIFCSSSLLFLLPALLGIVWFEKFGSDNKRTMINMLVSSVCWTAIQCGAIVQELILYNF